MTDLQPAAPGEIIETTPELNSGCRRHAVRPQKADGLSNLTAHENDRRRRLIRFCANDRNGWRSLAQPAAAISDMAHRFFTTLKVA